MSQGMQLSFKSPEKDRHGLTPRAYRAECSPADILIVIQYQISDLEKGKIIKISYLSHHNNNNNNSSSIYSSFNKRINLEG
jgi:hypothetical protein